MFNQKALRQPFFKELTSPLSYRWLRNVNKYSPTGINKTVTHFFKIFNKKKKKTLNSLQSRYFVVEGCCSNYYLVFYYSTLGNY